MIWGPNDNEGKNVFFPGNRLEWEKELGSEDDGLYRAQTKLFNPLSERFVLLRLQEVLSY
ncbi:hypothetical protein HQN89_11465 [Paenibacillus frigoriresistens]|nr:hypothetical protein [Paenibacillus frigoriresistens]